MYACGVTPNWEEATQGKLGRLIPDMLQHTPRKTRETNPTFAASVALNPRINGKGRLAQGVWGSRA
jgi:hypothetical protein